MDELTLEIDRGIKEISIASEALSNYLDIEHKIEQDDKVAVEAMNNTLEFITGESIALEKGGIMASIKKFFAGILKWVKNIIKRIAAIFTRSKPAEDTISDIAKAPKEEQLKLIYTNIAESINKLNNSNYWFKNHKECVKYLGLTSIRDGYDDATNKMHSMDITSPLYKIDALIDELKDSKSLSRESRMLYEWSRSVSHATYHVVVDILKTAPYKDAAESSFSLAPAYFNGKTHPLGVYRSTFILAPDRDKDYGYYVNVAEKKPKLPDSLVKPTAESLEPILKSLMDITSDATIDKYINLYYLSNDWRVGNSGMMPKERIMRDQRAVSSALEQLEIAAEFIEKFAPKGENEDKGDVNDMIKDILECSTGLSQYLMPMLSDGVKWVLSARNNYVLISCVLAYGEYHRSKPNMDELEALLND